MTANDANTSAMIATLTGQHEPTRQYFALSVIFIAMIPLLHAAASVLRVWSAETTGLLDVEVATGVQRWRPLAAQAVLSSAHVAGLLVIGALVQSAVAAAVEAGGDASRWALWTVLVQAPGAAAVVGITTMLVGLAPRLAGAAWLTVAWSAFAALLGGLVRLPEWARRSSLLGLELHDVSGPVSDALQWRSAALFAAVGLVTAAVGVSAMRRRDIVAAA